MEESKHGQGGWVGGWWVGGWVGGCLPACGCCAAAAPCPPRCPPLPAPALPPPRRCTSPKSPFTKSSSTSPSQSNRRSRGRCPTTSTPRSQAVGADVAPRRPPPPACRCPRSRDDARVRCAPAPPALTPPSPHRHHPLAPGRDRLPHLDLLHPPPAAKPVLLRPRVHRARVRWEGAVGAWRAWVAG